jgi:hypothetical protein
MEAIHERVENNASPPDNLSERAKLLEQALSGQGEMLAEAQRAHVRTASNMPNDGVG